MSAKTDKGHKMDKWDVAAAFDAYAAMQNKFDFMDKNDLWNICGEPDEETITDELDVAVQMYHIRRNRYVALTSA